MKIRPDTALGGLYVHCRSSREVDALEALLQRHDLLAPACMTKTRLKRSTGAHVTLEASVAQTWTPQHDTLQLTATLGLDTHRWVEDLEREILVALLASPIPFDFPSCDELLAAIRIRRNIVLEGRSTALNFHTDEADRPTDLWNYDDDLGFTVRPGCSLIKALKKATQPTLSGRMYAFSCYRATEYVILLGLAEELAETHPALYFQLQRQCQTRVIRSGQFHDVFLREYGTQDTPLPAHYYVPGDRVWFRNPDEYSSDVIGFEGSWVLYLGGGQFTNFWTCDQPYTLQAKCLEIHHWRDGVYRRDDGVLAMDESRVAEHVQRTLTDPEATSRVLTDMMRLREAKGCYGNGGCIDTTRESLKWVCPGTSDLVLPMR